MLATLAEQTIAGQDSIHIMAESDLMGSQANSRADTLFDNRRWSVLCGRRPHCKWRVGLRTRWSGAVLCPACRCRHWCWPLALMVSARWVPLCFAGHDADDVFRGVPPPGL